MQPAEPHADDLAPNGWPWSVLRGFRAGEQDALSQVYRLHAPQVAKTLRHGFTFESRGRAHRFAGYRSPFEFHDALHETFRRAFEPRARQSYDGIRPYGPYLRTIARNVVLRTFRAKEALFPSDDAATIADQRIVHEGALPNPEHVIHVEQVRGLVQTFLASCDPVDRDLLRLRFVEGMSQRDAAEQLGIGRQRVRGRETKLRAALLAFLQEHGQDPSRASLAIVPPIMGMELLRALAEALQ